MIKKICQGYKNSKMEENILDNLKMTRWKVQENNIGKMDNSKEIYMMVIIKMTRRMDKEYTLGLMETNMMEILKMTIGMEKE